MCNSNTDDKPLVTLTRNDLAILRQRPASDTCALSSCMSDVASAHRFSGSAGTRIKRAGSLPQSLTKKWPQTLTASARRTAQNSCRSDSRVVHVHSYALPVDLPFLLAHVFSYLPTQNARGMEELDCRAGLSNPTRPRLLDAKRLAGVCARDSLVRRANSLDPGL